jgi:hypothetical protein
MMFVKELSVIFDNTTNSYNSIMLMLKELILKNEPIEDPNILFADKIQNIETEINLISSHLIYLLNSIKENDESFQSVE